MGKENISKSMRLFFGIRLSAFDLEREKNSYAQATMTFLAYELFGYRFQPKSICPMRVTGLCMRYPPLRRAWMRRSFGMCCVAR